MKKAIFAFILFMLPMFVFAGCGVWGNDGTSDESGYHPSGEEAYHTFELQLRMPTEETEVSEGDTYAHSTIGGELIYSWIVPMYGNTVYESVLKFFENREDKITFRLSQHRYYMFHDCVLEDGSYFNLETVYVAADGKYANCANYQSVLGADGVAGTDDDLKVLTLVYKGWLY